MTKLHVKNGTPVGTTHLCNSCSWGQFITGYRESDRLAICTNTSPNIVLPFTVYECTGFNDKHRPGWDQMEKLAIDIQPTRRSSKTAGFTSVSSIRSTEKNGADASECEEDEHRDEAVLVP